MNENNLIEPAETISASTPAEVADETTVLLETDDTPVTAESAGEESAFIELDVEATDANEESLLEDDITPVLPATNVKIPDAKKPIITGVSKERWNPIAMTLPLVRYSQEEIIEGRRRSNKDFDPKLDEETVRWAWSIDAGVKHLPFGNVFGDTIKSQDRLWSNAIESGDGVILRPGVPRVEERDHRGPLRGREAISRINSLCGLGSSVRTPLWNTGIWLTFTPPREIEWLELYTRIQNEKVQLGRETNGLAFSNRSVYTSMYLVNFALAHVEVASVDYAHPEDLKKIIKVTDIPALLMGLLCATYPSGYRFTSPCFVDPSKCMHVVEELLNLSKLTWVDDKSITDLQRKIMVRRNSVSSPQDLQNYANEHRSTPFAAVSLTDSIKVRLKVPNIEEYERIGVEWVDSIIKSTDDAFQSTLSAKQREDYIQRAAMISSMNQFSHWIDEMTVDGHEIDRDAYAEALTRLTSDDNAHDNFFDGVAKFIGEVTNNIVAVPKFICPGCQQEYITPETSKHPHLIPLDVESVFFTLLDLRISKVRGGSSSKS